MTLFNSDIYNTFNSESENREQYLNEFLNNMNGLIEKFGEENVLFSFYSTDKIEDVLKYSKELLIAMKNDNTNFKMSTQYGDKQKYENDKIIDIDNSVQTKVDQMVKQIQIHKSNGVIIDRVIYADDSVINQQIFKYLINRKEKDIEFISLVPNCDIKSNDEDYFTSEKSGIKGLNECLSKYIYSLNNKKDKAL